MMMIRQLVIASIFSSASAYIVEKPGTHERLQNLLKQKEQGTGLAPSVRAGSSIEEMQAVGQQGMMGETNDLMKRLNLGSGYAVAVVETEEDVQEQIESTVKDSIITGWDVEDEEDEDEVAPVKEASVITTVTDDFTTKFAERKPQHVVSVYPPVTAGPTVNIKPKMKPAFVEKAPKTTAGIDATIPHRRRRRRRTREVEDTDVVLQNEMQEIPVLKEEEATTTTTTDAAPADSVVSQLQEKNQQAVMDLTEYFANRYHNDNWFDNPNSNNLFLQAMHAEGEEEVAHVKELPVITTATDDFTAKFAEKKPQQVVSMYPPVTAGPTVNIKPKMKPAFVEEAPRATGGMDTSVLHRRHHTREVEDMDVVLQNEMQEIPVLKEEVATDTTTMTTTDAAPADSVVSQLQEKNQQAVTGQSTYYAERYHYDNWFDNPNANNLFLRAMHME
jgi:hypothetical protein